MKLTRRAVAIGLGTIAGLIGAGKVPVAYSDPLAETIAIETASGRRIEAVLAVPSAVPAPAVMIIHGSLGASAWYNSLASEIAKDGFVGLSIDLYGGEVTTDLTQGAILRGKALADLKGTNEIIRAWLDWLRRDRRTNQRVGIIGFSFGASLASEFAMIAPVDATVLYYGLPSTQQPQQIGAFHGAALGHFAKSDPQIGNGSVEGFARRMKKESKVLELHWHEAGHSFANPERPEFDPKAAEAAWRLTLAFLKARLS